MSHAALFKNFLVLDSTAVSDVQKQFTIVSNRTRTTRCETLITKAISATTKTLVSQQETIRDTLADHARFTKDEPEKHFCLPLLTEARRILATTASSSPSAAAAEAAAPVLDAKKAAKIKKDDKDKHTKKEGKKEKGKKG